MRHRFTSRDAVSVLDVAFILLVKAADACAAEITIIMMILLLTPYHGHRKWHARALAHQPLSQACVAACAADVWCPALFLVPHLTPEVVKVGGLHFHCCRYTSLLIFFGIPTTDITEVVRMIGTETPTHVDLKERKNQTLVQIQSLSWTYKQRTYKKLIVDIHLLIVDIQIYIITIKEN